jgi:protein CpxP
MKIALRSLTALAALAAITSFAPISAHAHSSCDGPHGYRHGHHFKKMAAELGLSDQQQLQIKEIMKKNRPRFEPLMQQKKTEQRALRTLIQGDTIDDGAIRAQAAKLSAVEADLAVQRAHGAQEIRKVLTTEQVKKFRELQAKRDQRMDAFHDHSGKHIDKHIEQDK